MQIISAARGTGKSFYAELCRNRWDLVDGLAGINKPCFIVKPDGIIQSMEIYVEPPYVITPSFILKKDYCPSFGELPEGASLIIEEPAYYHKGQFSEIMDTFGKNVKLVIGTPVCSTDDFSTFLQTNRDNVVRWAHSPEEL